MILTIHRKLIISFSIATVLIALSGGISYFYMTQIEATREALDNEILPATLMLGKMKYSVSEIFSSADEYVYIPNDADREEESQFIKEESVKLPILLEDYFNIVNTQDPIEIATAHDFEERVSEFIFTTEAFVETSYNGDEDRLLLYHGLLEEEKNNVVSIIDSQLDMKQQELDEGHLQVRALQDLALQITIVLSVCFLALTLIIGYLIHRSIAIRLFKLKEAVMKIGRGMFDIEIPYSHQKQGEKTKDEIQDLAVHIETMKSELMEKDKMKQEFINIAAHELRTPIQPILNYSDLAARGIINQAQANEEILIQARRLKRISEDILDVARIEGKALNLNRERFNLRKIIEQIVKEKSLALGSNVVIETALNEIGELEVDADLSRLIQVVSNILGNAMKFTKKGKIRIEANVIDNQETVQLTISDTGPGIPDEILQRLFEKFSSKSVQSGTEHGTGLGLYLCKAIIEAHGGSIAGHNNETGGATFKIYLPVSSRKKSEGFKPSANPQSILKKGKSTIAIGPPT